MIPAAQTVSLSAYDANIAVDVHAITASGTCIYAPSHHSSFMKMLDVKHARCKHTESIR
jgi:hypothetical protein